MNRKQIIIFGDSLTYGQGDSQQGGWVSRLQKKLGSDFELKNFGIPGDTSEDLLNRIQNQLGNSNPDLIIISIGANDSQYKEDKNKTLIRTNKFKENLEKFFEISKKHSQNIIFVGIPNMDDSITNNWHYLYYFCNENISLFNSYIKEFCNSKNIQFIDIFGIIEKEDSDDGAHPNSKGYEKIANKIYQFLVDSF